LYFGRFAVVHIGGPSSNQAASLESQPIHQIQLLFGRTLRSLQRALRNLPKKAPRLPAPLPAAPSIPINPTESIPKPADVKQEALAIGDFSRQKHPGASDSAMLQGAIMFQGFSIFWRYKCMTTVSYHNTPNNCFYIPFSISSFAALAVAGVIHGIIRDLKARKIKLKSIIIEAVLAVFFICTIFYSIYQLTTHGTWPYRSNTGQRFNFP
jgi:hypothetical protein